MKIYVLGSGSKGNSTFIKLDNANILIDVGFSYAQIKDKLSKIDIKPEDIDFILITHNHSDHIKGLETFIKKNNTFVFVSDVIANECDYLKQYKNRRNISNIDSRYYKIKLINASHDALDTKGFLIEEKESLVYLTDTGYLNKRYIDKLKNKEYYIFESNHDEEMLRKGPYPEHLQRRILSNVGHLSNRSSSIYLSLLIGSKTKKIVLAHLSESNNTPEKALNTFNDTMKENKIKFNNVECAKQNEMVIVND